MKILLYSIIVTVCTLLINRIIKYPMYEDLTEKILLGLLILLDIVSIGNLITLILLAIL